MSYLMISGSVVNLRRSVSCTIGEVLIKRLEDHLNVKQ